MKNFKNKENENEKNSSVAGKVNNPKLRIIPLGGLQSIGMNMMLIEYGNEVIIVDCGFMFPRYHMLGIDYVIPDMSYLEGKNVVGLLLTHGHEDHIGAIPYLLKAYPNIPIYGTRLTIAFLRSKLLDQRHNLKNAKLTEVFPREKKRFGVNFEVEFIRVNHSIPDGVALAINTPVGTLIHTGDFKIDTNPMNDTFIDLYKFAEYGEKGVLLLMADSTNVEKEGISLSEAMVAKKMNELFSHDDGMIIVAVFASSIERIQDLVTAAKNNDKYVALSGRSLLKFTDIAEKLGYLDLYKDVVIPIDKIKNFPRNKVVCITTGTQGEPYSSLALMASKSHRHISVEEGDIVIFSSSIIPGNEVSVARMVNGLFDLGASFVQEDKKALHVSGHATSEDLKIIYRLVKPQYFVPVHGEKRHLAKHIELVENLTGIDSEGFLLHNGSVLQIDKDGIVSFDESLELRNIYVDGKGVGDLEDSILNERSELSSNGAVFVNILIYRKNNNYDINVEIDSKGFIYSGGSGSVEKNEKIIQEGKLATKDAVLKLLNKNKKTPSTMRYEIREALNKKFEQIIGRKPVIFIFVNFVAGSGTNSNAQVNNTNNNEKDREEWTNNQTEDLTKSQQNEELPKTKKRKFFQRKKKKEI